MRWTRNAVLPIFGLLLAVSMGCSKGGKTNNGPNPPGAWDFPANATKHAITLYTDKAHYAVGDTFDVKVVLYNVADVFGTALAVNYPHADMQPVGYASGLIFSENPALFLSASNHLVVAGADTASAAEPDTVSYGFSYLRGGPERINGSTVLMKFRFKVKAAGTVTFTIDDTQLAINDENGAPISGFDTMLRESATVIAP